MKDEDKTKEQLIAELNRLRPLVDAQDAAGGKSVADVLAKAQADVEAADRELKEFVYVVSHDLRAPLRAVRQLASWLAEDHANSLSTEGKQLIDMLLGRLDRMNNLLEAILQYSRIGRIKEKERDVDVSSLIPHVIQTLSHSNKVKMLVQKSLPTVFFEHKRLEEVFRRLLDNAIKFMDKPEGEVKIRCQDDGTHWKFSIEDNGPGIEKKYHEKVFRIFQTLAARDELESAGMGLTLTKKIIESAGGTIWLESEKGKGSTFLFTIPKKSA